MRASRSIRFESLEARQLLGFGQPDPDFGVARRASVDLGWTLVNDQAEVRRARTSAASMSWSGQAQRL